MSKKNFKININETYSKSIVGKPINYNFYREEILNGADTILYENMIGVKYEAGAWVKADVQNEWYSYENFNWANCVVVGDDKKEFYKKALSGTQISKKDGLGFFVWIPRFEYKLFNVEFKPVQEQMIYTHPAFSTKAGELNGFWIAKFEPSLNDGVIEILSSKETLVNLNMAENGNNAYLATANYPWIKIGGSFRGGSYSGIFDFGITDA